jgi:C4-dicarboxylate-specific signal transduction histidine kinase
VRSIIEENGGEVSAANGENGGAVVRIRLASPESSAPGESGHGVK